MEKVYYQMSTTNKSFLDMHHHLEKLGIQNNKFMLVLFDPDLTDINPHDKSLNTCMKKKVLRECLINYWYFLREVIRIPNESDKDIKYELHRGNLALNFCMISNLNIFFELPSQNFKNISAMCRYLYLLNFGNRSNIIFLDKKLNDSISNLHRVKKLRECLPSYLRLYTDNEIYHSIKPRGMVCNKQEASNLLRGNSIQMIFADNYSRIRFNSDIYMNILPAFSVASANAKRDGESYGMLITTFSGDLNTNEGRHALRMRDSSVKFNEIWYDLTYKEIKSLVNFNSINDFVHIKFTYQELGKTLEWFNDMCKAMNNEWESIRSMLLLEWGNESNDKSSIAEFVKPSSLKDTLN